MGQVINLDLQKMSHQPALLSHSIQGVIATSMRLDASIGEVGEYLKMCVKLVDGLNESPIKIQLRQQLEMLRGQLLIASLEVAKLIVLQRKLQGTQKPNLDSMASADEIAAR